MRNPSARARPRRSASVATPLPMARTTSVIGRQPALDRDVRRPSYRTLEVVEGKPVVGVHDDRRPRPVRRDTAQRPRLRAVRVHHVERALPAEVGETAQRDGVLAGRDRRDEGGLEEHVHAPLGRGAGEFPALAGDHGDVVAVRVQLHGPPQRHAARTRDEPGDDLRDLDAGLVADGGGHFRASSK